MFPAEPSTQDVLFTDPLLHEAMATVPEALAPVATRDGVEFSFRRPREAALLHRNGRLRAIQALHRPKKP